MALAVLEALSGIAGSISLASWILLLLPQLYDNYRNQSSEALSKVFILIWMLGDICNLTGALWAHLIPTVVAIALYFCISDGALIAQCLYYDFKSRRHGQKEAAEIPATIQPDEDEDDNTPLLRRSSKRVGNGSLPAPHRRSSASQKPPQQPNVVATDQDVLHRRSRWRATLLNAVAVLSLCAVGTLGWALAWQIGAWSPRSASPGSNDRVRSFGAEALGYASAVAYLGARIPQIIKNWRAKSTEGLSLLFFILSLLGNLTQGATILLHSVEKEYILKNLPWLIGSLGTMAEDVTIFAQFHIYKRFEDRGASSAVQ